MGRADKTALPHGTTPIFFCQELREYEDEDRGDLLMFEAAEMSHILQFAHEEFAVVKHRRQFYLDLEEVLLNSSPFPPLPLP